MRHLASFSKEQGKKIGVRLLSCASTVNFLIVPQDNLQFSYFNFILFLKITKQILPTLSFVLFIEKKGETNSVNIL